MNDLEICKRVAEIYLECDWVVNESNQSIEIVGTQTYLGAHGIPDEKTVVIKAFNPLTDDALCFMLMVKYEVEIDFKNKRAMFDAPCKNPIYRTWVKFSDMPLNKAICLAIIKAHEVKQ